MMEALNGKERTVVQMKELLDQSGWKVIHVHQTPVFSGSKVIGAPV